MLSRMELSLWGGGFYLLNKVFLNLMERARPNNVQAYWLFRQFAWIVYLIGLPFIVFMFFREKNWIFGMIELGGAPAMAYGILAAFSKKKGPAWLDHLALAAIPVGLVLSFLNFREARTFALEVLGSAGFLVGTYLLSKDRKGGYWWFTLMNLATGWLLYIENYPLFVPQQIFSVLLVLDAMRIRNRNDRILSANKELVCESET